MLIVLRSVVTGARLYLVIGVVGFDLDLAEFSVPVRVRGRIADRILVAQFFLNFFENFVQRVLCCSR